MALCASGEMALGGSTTGRSVNLELARAFNAGICMNETPVRTLAGVASGQISMSNFYGKSSAPTTLGQYYEGGYYTGVIDIGGGVTYYLMVAPNATGCAVCQWKTANSFSGTCCCFDGYKNTQVINNTTHPAASFCATRSIAGYADWYLPAFWEHAQMYNNKGSMPAGENYCSCGTTAYYWMSTEYATTTCAQLKWYQSGGSSYSCKITSQKVRALRRKKT